MFKNYCTKKIFYSFILLILFCFNSFAQNKVVKIWPSLAPGTESRPNNEKIENQRITNVYQPDLTIFLPDRPDANHSALLVFPGGGYNHVTIEKEGYKIAKWLNDNGIAAFVLKYRLNIPEALEDAQRAVSFVRANAKHYKVNQNNIGAIGFSAGGHLAANLAIHSKKSVIVDHIDSVSCKLNFLVLVYGWLQDLSQSVNNNFPPTFFVHAGDDSRVPAEQSINLFSALQENGVPAEIHIFQNGGHGFGLEQIKGAIMNWNKVCIAWMKEREILLNFPMSKQ